MAPVHTPMETYQAPDYGSQAVCIGASHRVQLYLQCTLLYDEDLHGLTAALWLQPLAGTLARRDSDTDVKFIIALDKSGCEAAVVLRRDAKQEDVLKAYVQGYLLLHFSAPVVRTSLL
jgi:hypothetical protein